MPPEIIIGPVRVFPGWLSVCWTFGDFEAKVTSQVVISWPEIWSFKLDESHDFVILGCDGIFDKLSDWDCVDCVWNTVRGIQEPDLHDSLGTGAECIMKNALNWRSLDNVTVVIVAFNGFWWALEDMKTSATATPNTINASRGYKKMGPQSVRTSIGGVTSVRKYHWDLSSGI